MRFFSYSMITALFATSLALAGFRHPIEQTGPAAMAVQSTPIHQSVAAPSRMMPDRMQKTPRALAGHSAGTKSNAGPLPKAPSLPASVRFNIPDFHLGRASLGDGLSVQQPEELQLRGGINRTQIHTFLRQIRAMPMPNHEYGNNARGRELAKRFHSAIEPTRFVSFRTPYELKIERIGKIPASPTTSQYENTVQRIDSLFLGLNGIYPRAILGLWQLAESPTNNRGLQARDALFAGLLSERAGWDASASNLFEAGATKGLDKEDRYLKILWNQLDLFANSNHVDRVVAKVNPKRVLKIKPSGDSANFAMAKRAMSEVLRPPHAPLPAPERFAQEIRSNSLQERFLLLQSLRNLKSPKKSLSDAALDNLKILEAKGGEEFRQGARLALARVSLQNGAAAEALSLYRNIAKNGKNRLEVLSEQIYAEYQVGDFQGSLGKSIGLQSAFFQYGFAPDVHFVEIMSRQSMCDFGGAEAGVKEFLARYKPELEALEATLLKAKDPADYYSELVGYHAEAQPKRFQRYLLQLGSVMENQKTMNQALLELKKLDELGVKHPIPERPLGWEKFAQAMREDWAKRAGDLRLISSRAALHEAEYLAKRLHHEFAEAELLDIDISTGATKNYHVQSAMNFPAQKAKEAKLQDSQVRWPFEKEIWEDEIEFMRTKNPTKCGLAAAAH